MNINLLLNPSNRSWIIQKITENLAVELRQSGISTSITEEPDKNADLVHHMSWAFANVKTPQPSTMFITHLDDAYKLKQVRATLSTYVRVGICMSADTMRQLQAFGCNADSLYFVSPAHDGVIRPRRIVIGITSRVYADGRKRETLLREVASQTDLSAFVFQIFGLGWEATIPALEEAGAEVEYFGETDDFRKDYHALQAAIPKFDYYLYMGMDEGSLGTLDALAAGVATIVTPQGFHLDLPGGITHSIVTGEDLSRVFAQIAAERQSRVSAVSGLTWAAYADRHRALWERVVSGQPLPELLTPAPARTCAPAAAEALRYRQISTNALRPRRMISALSHLPALRGLRRLVELMRRAR